MKLRVSQRFRDELKLEVRFIAERNPQAARMVRDRVLKAIDQLKLFPDSSRGWRIADCRELVISGLPYIVIYQVNQQEVLLLRLFHTSRVVPHVH